MCVFFHKNLVGKKGTDYIILTSPLTFSPGFTCCVASTDPDHQRDKQEITQNSSEDKSIWENLLFDNLGNRIMKKRI